MALDEHEKFLKAHSTMRHAVPAVHLSAVDAVIYLENFTDRVFRSKDIDKTLFRRIVSLAR
jgi:hypothetical protein